MNPGPRTPFVFSVFRESGFRDSPTLVFQAFDYLPQPKADDHLNPVKCFLGEVGIHKYLTHPYVSPLFGDFTGLPPLLIQAGEAEVLRDEITLLAHKASLAGVEVSHEIFEDCVHVFQTFLFLEASRRAFNSQRNFVNNQIPSLRTTPVVPQGGMDAKDAEIVSDAHVVLGNGKQNPKSLPSSPRPEDPPLPEEEDTDADSIVTHPSPQSTPELGQDPLVAADEEGVKVDGEGDEYTWTKSTPVLTTSTAAATSTSSSSTSTPHSPSSSGTVTPRPLLRAYTSARNLFMTKSVSHESTPVTSPLQSPKSTRQSRSMSATIPILGIPLGLGLSGDQGGPLVAKEMESTPLHARSSSHPDLRSLLEDYAEKGPSNSTIVFGKA